MPDTPGLELRGIVRPQRLRDYRLIAFDMDATLIDIETVDELADLAGCRAAVQAITEATMRGEIADFTQSLRQRVALLAGLPEQALDTVYTERLRLNPGAQELITACRAAGLRCMLVSGGFSHFTERLRGRLGLDEVHSNQLELADGRLTGRLLPLPGGGLVDGEEKKRKLLQVCAQMGIAPAQAIAVGDGANDLPMLGAAGLAVAYRAKPVVRQQAHVAINAGGLDRLLEVLDARD